MPLARQRERGLSVGRLDHAIAFPAHRRSQKVAGVWIVVNDHYQGRMLDALGTSHSGCRLAAVGECDRKGRALSRSALDGDPAAEHLAEMLRDGEPEPCAAILSRRRQIGLTECLKQPALLLIGHADPGIAADQRDFAVGTYDLDPDAAVTV